MSIVLYNAVVLTMEALKLYIVTTIFLNIKQKKSVFISFLVVLASVIIVTIFLGNEISEYAEFIIGCLAILLFCFNAENKRKFGVILLSYVVICIVDVLISMVFILLMNSKYNYDAFMEDYLLDIVINSISFFVFLIIAFFIIRKRIKFDNVLNKKYILVYILSAFALILYLSAIQCIGFGEDYSVYGDVFTIGLTIISLMLVVVCVLLIINTNKNEYLKKEANFNDDLMKKQKEYYDMLLQKENETRAFRHDIKNHIYCMDALYKNGRYDEFGKYISGMSVNIEKLSQKTDTGNDLITSITNDITNKFPDVKLNWVGTMPENMKITSIDICTIFYNLLLNAFEAADKTDKKYVSVEVRFMESSMIFTIVNSGDKEPHVKNGELMSDKKEEGHGYGVTNVKKCLKKYDGKYSIDYKSGEFVSEVFLPSVLV